MAVPVTPSRLRDQILVDGLDADPLFHAPSNSDTVLNPVHVYEPLEEILREETLDGRSLGEVVFGEIRQYRSGGEVHMDILFDGLEVTLPDRENEPITIRLTSGYDFFGGHAVYVEGLAQDTACKNSIRSLTDKEIVKHVGDVEDFGGWWESILAELEPVADDLFGFIEDAQDITIDFTDVLFSITEFYELLDFPLCLARYNLVTAEGSTQDRLYRCVESKAVS